jgi:mTERF domain-containing protein
MLRLPNNLLPAVRAAWHLPAASSLHHLFLYSTAAATTKPAAPFVAEQYLVTTCGLTPEQALRSAKYLAHLKSSSNPDAVLAFFAEIGLHKADVAAAIAMSSRILCLRVDETLTPRIGMLRDIGLSTPQISRLVTVAPLIFSNPTKISRLPFYLSLLGSYDKVHTALKRNILLLSRNIESVVEPNVAFLRHCGLSDCEIAKLLLASPRMLALEPEAVKEIVVCADMLGVPRNSRMFKRILSAIASITPPRVGAKLDFLRKALGCSETEVGIAIGKLPNILCSAEDKLNRSVEFLKMEVGLNAVYIVHRPALLGYDLKKRLMPRYYVLKILKEKGLVKENVDFYGVVSKTEKKFVERFLDPHKESVPGLSDAYAAACAGQVPPAL